jgi:hypothetical protein
MVLLSYIVSQSVVRPCLTHDATGDLKESMQSGLGFHPIDFSFAFLNMKSTSITSSKDG